MRTCFLGLALLLALSSRSLAAEPDDIADVEKTNDKFKGARSLTVEDGKLLLK
ncbi:MAG: hypothetical protein K2R98_17800 [Gemmataceae bacterium]|nr:hypothetical protein [Gemmataceae bacterium]